MFRLWPKEACIPTESWLSTKYLEIKFLTKSPTFFLLKPVSCSLANFKQNKLCEAIGLPPLPLVHLHQLVVWVALTPMQLK